MPAYRGFEDINCDSNSRKEMILKSSYRVSVCLKRYFTDIRALSYVLVTRRKTVKWLEKKIRKLFDVNGSFVLATRGHLMPSSERLALLNADDVVEVIPNEIASQVQKQICVDVSNNVLDVENENITTDECDSGGNQKEECTSKRIKQKDATKENDLEEHNLIIANKKAEQFQNDNINDAVGKVNNVNIITDECNSSINQMNKYSLFGPSDCSKVLELEQNVAKDNSFNSNTHHLSTGKSQDILEEVKRNALAILDSNYSTCLQGTQSVNGAGGTRKRKRVRRKRPQVVFPAIIAENSFEEDSFTCNLPEEDKNNSATESCTPISVVSILHNQEAYIRKPRIVPSIVEDT